MQRTSKFGWLVLGLVLACASSPKPVAAPAAQTPPLTAPSQVLAEYRIASGDELEIALPLNPELSVRTFVRPDGKISLELID